MSCANNEPRAAWMAADGGFLYSLMIPHTHQKPTNIYLDRPTLPLLSIHNARAMWMFVAGKKVLLWIVPSEKEDTYLPQEWSVRASELLNGSLCQVEAQNRGRGEPFGFDDCCRMCDSFVELFFLAH